METAVTVVSDREISEDDHHCSDESEYGSDDECIDILNEHSADEADDASDEEQKEENCDEVGGGGGSSSNANKFSIDTILGLKTKGNECNNANRSDFKYNKETKCIKPTPVPAIPRGTVTRPNGSII